MSSRSVRVVAAVAATLCVAAVTQSPAAAKDRAPDGPVGRHFADLDAAGGIEFRMLAVFPIERTSIAADDRSGKSPAVRPRFASLVEPDLVGVSKRRGGGTRRLQLDNLGMTSLVALPGQIVRSDRFDLALTAHVTVKPAGGKRLPELAIVSRDDVAQKAPPERVVTDDWLPPTLRWIVSPARKSRDARATCDDWARMAGVLGGRRSVAQLGAGPVIAKRVADYASILRDVVRALPGRDVVGYAAYLDDVPLIVETFGDAETFRRLWPGLSRALAVEAAIREVEEGILDQDIAPQPLVDRMLGATRAILRSAADRKGIAFGSGSTGYVTTVRLDRGTARCLVVRGSGLVHSQILLSPGERAAIAREVDEEDTVRERRRPNGTRRPGRETFEEKRVNDRVDERRNEDENGKTKPPKIPPPPNPLPPPVEFEEPEEPKPSPIESRSKK